MLPPDEFLFILIFWTRLLGFMFFLLAVEVSAGAWLRLASVLATWPLGVLVPMAGIVDWAWLALPTRQRANTRLRIRFIGIRVRSTLTA
jgi:hypothetical protein